MSEEDDKRSIALFEKEYKKYFTEYTDFQKIRDNVKSYKYLVEQLRNLDSNFPESDYKHVMSKKILLTSKNAKKMCRDGVPIKFMRNVIVKMFNISFSAEDFENKKKECLRGRDVDNLDKNCPTFTNKYFDESLQVNYLNEKGISALKEILWCLNSVIGPIEYSPLIIKVSSILLLFISKEETYEVMRQLLEINLRTPDEELVNIRWQFRFKYIDYLKLKYAIEKSIYELCDAEVLKRIKNLTNMGFNRYDLVQNMTENFFLGYINFCGILKLLPLFLYEGEKMIYRLCYGIISMTIYSSPGKKTQEEFIKTYKTFSNRIENLFYLFDISYKWNLTHNNNHFNDIQIPKHEKTNMPIFNKYYYIPKFLPESKILKEDEIPKIWSYLPLSIKIADAKLLLDKKNSPEADLNCLIDI